MNWNDLKLILAVVQASSMRAAARELKISHTTVSRRIDNLENSLKVKLFERLSTGYRLTKSGQELVDIARETDKNLHAFGREVIGRDSALKGQVCVTIPNAFACSAILPIFSDFMDCHPDIQVKIDASMEVLDLTKREADVAIRFTNEPPEYLIGRKIGVIHQAAYATREYVREHPPFLNNSSARWIGWGTPENRPRWIEKSPFPYLGVFGHFNDVQIQIEAAKTSKGIGYFPCVAGDMAGELIRLSKPMPLIDVWMLSHQDLRTSARMRAFRSYIMEHIPTLKKHFSGDFGKTINAENC